MGRTKIPTPGTLQLSLKNTVENSPKEVINAENEEEIIRVDKNEKRTQYETKNKDILQLKQDIDKHRVIKHDLVRRLRDLKQRTDTELDSIQSRLHIVMTDKAIAEKDAKELKSISFDI